MITKVLFVAMSCGIITLEGFDRPLNLTDNAVIERAKQVCRDQYDGCVKSITKTSEDSYQVLCGVSN